MADLEDILSGDTFDSRQIIERIEEIENDHVNDDGDIVFDIEAEDDYERFMAEDDKAEYAKLKAIEEECEGYPDWQYGTTFIRDSFFEDYARELAEDIGAIDRDQSWPNSYIDWGAAARALQMDYTSVEIDGEDWWYR